jgi:hypothetical protein
MSSQALSKHRCVRSPFTYPVYRTSITLIIVIVTALREDLERFNLQEFASGEIGTPDQVAALVSYLVSKDAQYVTGKDSRNSSRNLSDTSALGQTV